MKVRLFKTAAAMAAAFTLISCVTSSTTKTNSSGVELTYPDPDDDKDVPKFCNPTGKKGEALKLCYEHNETLYKGFEDEAKQREPWFNFAPDNWAESIELDSRLIYGVKNEADAVKQLETVPFVALTESDAEKISGVKAAIAGHKPFLVRALYYFKETGTFSIFEKSGAVLVRHDSIGSTTPKEVRSAVIVFLKDVPKAVYVDCQVAE